MITSLSFITKARLKKYKKARYSIGNVSEKDLHRMIKDFEKIEKLPYDKNRTKNEPTERYFHLAKKLCKVYDKI